MQIKFFRKNSEVMKYLIVYLCVLLPILLVSITLSNLLISALKQQSANVIEANISRIAVVINNSYDGYQRTAVSLMNKREYSYSHLSADGIDAIECISDISMVTSMNHGVDSVGLVFSANDSVYSMGGKSNRRVYLKETLSLDTASQIIADEIFDQNKSSAAFLTDTQGRGMLLFQFSSRREHNTDEIPNVAIVYDFEDLESHLITGLGKCPAYIFLTIDDIQCVVLYYDGSGILQLADKDKILASGLTDGYQNLYDQQIVAGISLQVFCQTDSLFAQVGDLRTMYVISLTIGILVAMALCYLLSNRRYQYLERLYRASSNCSTVIPLNEQMVFNKVSAVVEQREIARRKNEANKSLLMQQNTILLFHGLLQNDKAIETLLRNSGMSVAENGVYSMAGMLLPNGNYQIEAICSVLGSNLYYEVKIDDMQALLVIVPMLEEDVECAWRRELGHKLSDLLHEFGEARSIIAFSRGFSNVSMCGKVLVEVSAMLTYLWNQSKQDQIAFGEEVLTTQSSMRHLPESSVRMLQKMLQKRDEKGAIQLVRKLCQQINSQQISFILRRYLRYEIVYAIVQEIRSEEKEQELLLADMVEINTDDAYFEANLRQVISKFCRARTKNAFDFQDVLNYIDAHYMDSGLSQMQIADHFQVSRSYLSTLFKSKTGYSYMEYLTELRMNQALKLLRSGLKVQEVTTKVGYNDESNFRKRFRERYGINPSDVAALESE